MHHFRSEIFATAIIVACSQTTSYAQGILKSVNATPIEELERRMGFGDELDRIREVQVENARRDRRTAQEVSAAIRLSRMERLNARSTGQVQLAGYVMAVKDREHEAKHQALRELKARHAELKQQFESNHPKLEAIERQIESLSSYLEQASDDDDHDDGDQNPDHLRRELKELSQKRREIQKKLDDTDNDDDRERLHDQLHKLNGAFEKIEHRLHAHERDHDRRGRHEREDREDENAGREREHQEEIRVHEERIHALHEAAERLEAGGVHDVAHEMHRRAEEMERELKRHRERGHGAHEVLHELMKNIHELRGEMREVHRKLDRIIEFIEEEREEGRHEYDEACRSLCSRAATPV